ncbi:lysophospholipase, partial [Myxococcota bacterium]|nr:lysophospholipase [Myxococcota bacterium]
MEVQTPHRKVLRYTLRIVIGLAVAYTLLCVALYFLQPRLIYFPQKSFAGFPPDQGLPFRDVTFPSGNNTIHGWFIPNNSGSRLVLFSHGNGGNISHRLHSLRVWFDLGFSVLIYDYAGYGKSTGKPTEAGTYRDLSAAWEYAQTVLGFKPAQILLFGRSLGGAVTAHLAQRVKPLGIVLESTFT